MLPKCILDLIDHYVGQFVLHESLPKISAVRRLVKKSNQEIFSEFMMINMSIGNDPTPLYSHVWYGNRILAHASDISLMVQSVSTCVRVGRRSASLYWLIQQKRIHDYPRYTEVLKGSLVFRLRKMLHILDGAWV